jgi:hypothetical protein
MKLRDALLCIDCDELFAISEGGSVCNPRCPHCASSVFAPLSTWIETWAGRENPRRETDSVARDGASARRPRMEIIHSRPAAA